jgi:hypothetical protein
MMLPTVGSHYLISCVDEHYLWVGVELGRYQLSQSRDLWFEQRLNCGLRHSKSARGSASNSAETTTKFGGCARHTREREGREGQEETLSYQIEVGDSGEEEFRPKKDMTGSTHEAPTCQIKKSESLIRLKFQRFF